MKAFCPLKGHGPSRWGGHEVPAPASGEKSTKEEIEESERDYLQKSLQFLNFSLLVQACCSFQANTNWFGTKILISTFGPSDRCSGLETVDSPKRNYYAIIILDVKRNVCALMVWLA